MGLFTVFNVCCLLVAAFGRTTPSGTAANVTATGNGQPQYQGRPKSQYFVRQRSFENVSRYSALVECSRIFDETYVL